MSPLTYHFPDFYWQTNRVPFDGFGGKLFSNDTSNCVGQSANEVVNFVLSNGHFVKSGLCHCRSNGKVDVNPVGLME